MEVAERKLLRSRKCDIEGNECHEHKELLGWNVQKNNRELLLCTDCWLKRERQLYEHCAGW
jgi:hypothetical protein